MYLNLETFSLLTDTYQYSNNQQDYFALGHVLR